MDQRLVSISEVSERTGLPTSALRYYERAGLLHPRTRKGGRRHYDHSVFQSVAAIGLFQEVGFTISEIKELLGDKARGERWRALAREKLREIDEHVDKVTAARELLRAALACQCSSVHECDFIEQRRRHPQIIHALTLRTAPPK